jgi:hypothetical protein
MPIPTNITRQHIIRAINRVTQQGVPPRRGARHWAVLYNGIQYPCKLLISWANVYANNEELNPNPNVFTTYMAQDYLIEKQFQVIPI